MYRTLVATVHIVGKRDPHPRSTAEAVIDYSETVSFTDALVTPPVLLETVRSTT